MTPQQLRDVVHDTEYDLVMSYLAIAAKAKKFEAEVDKLTDHTVNRLKTEGFTVENVNDNFGPTSKHRISFQQ